MPARSLHNPCTTRSAPAQDVHDGLHEPPGLSWSWPNRRTSWRGDDEQRKVALCRSCRGTRGDCTTAQRASWGSRGSPGTSSRPDLMAAWTTRTRFTPGAIPAPAATAVEGRAPLALASFPEGTAAAASGTRWVHAVGSASCTSGWSRRLHSVPLVARAVANAWAGGRPLPGTPEPGPGSVRYDMERSPRSGLRARRRPCERRTGRAGGQR